MATELTPIAYNAVSPAVMHALALEIADYSVAVARITGAGKQQMFTILGSGTCVRRGKAHGILTAHHVLHYPENVVLGQYGPDRIFFFARGNRTLEAMPVELREVPLGLPAGKYQAEGPDLTFIEITSDSFLSSFKAVCSFWSLDKAPHEVCDPFGIDHACLIHTGYPSCGFSLPARDESKRIHRDVRLFAGSSGLLQQDISYHDGWDVVTSFGDRQSFPQIPESYDGMSGGGIWSAVFKLNQRGQREVHSFALVGVNFWQGDPSPKGRSIRGHFIESIYRTGWERADLSR